MKIIAEFTRRLIIEYNNLSQPIKASIWFTLTNIIQKGLYFLITPIYTRVLNTQEYGHYSVFMSWINILIVFATLNLSSGVYNNGMIKYEEHQEKFTSSMQGLTLVITSLFLICYILFHTLFDVYLNLSSFEIVLMFLYFYFAPPMSFWSASQKFHYKYRCLTILTLLYSIVYPLISIFLIIESDQKGNASIIGLVVSNIVFGLFFMILIFSKGKTFCNKDYWIFALKFNIPLIPHYLSGMLLGQSDRVMISVFCGESEAGIYSFAAVISSALNIIINGVFASFTPWLYQNIKHKTTEKIPKAVNGVVLLMIAFSIMTILIVPELIPIVGTSDYDSAKMVIPPLIAADYFFSLTFIFGGIVFYFEKNICIMATSVISALGNVMLNAIFIPIYGYVIAGYTTLFCYFLCSILLYVFASHTIKKEKLEQIFDIYFICMTTILFIIVIIVCAILYNYLLLRYLFFTLFLLILSMNKEKVIKLAKSIYR